jgi:hypothetical protein
MLPKISRPSPEPEKHPYAKSQMKKEKNSCEAAALGSTNGRHYKRIVAIVCVGVVSVFTELFCLPMLVPKRITSTQIMHGDLISPPVETNFTTTADVPSAKQTPIHWNPDDPRHGTIATGGPRAYVAESRPNIVNTEIDNTETTDGGYLQIGFNKLAAFQVKVIYQIVDPVRLTTIQKLNRQIPDSIKSLDGREIALRGFMLPLKWENARVKEFLLMRSRAFCCFGKTLEINELAYVRMKGNGVKSIMDRPLTVYGTLHVGEIIQHGRLNGIYQLDATKMDGPTDAR